MGFLPSVDVGGRKQKLLLGFFVDIIMGV